MDKQNDTTSRRADLVEISVETDGEAAEAISAVLGQYGIGGAVVEEVWPTDPSQSPAVRVKAFLPGDRADQLRTVEIALWHLARIHPFSEPQIRTLQQADWQDAWKAGYTVQHIGERIAVKPSWLDFAAQPGHIVVELDPGMAFGTGLHPSTRLMLEAMERHLIVDAPVLDVGTGSGILSIVAAKMGGRPIQALEIDDLAIGVARDNVRRNHVDHAVRVHRASLTPVGIQARQSDIPEVFNRTGDWNGAFATVLMNILAEVIAECAPALAACLAPSGTFIVAGIILPREHLVQQALDAAGLVVVERLQQADWLALVGGKRH